MQRVAMRCATACTWEAKFWLGQPPWSMHFPHKWWLCRGHGYPNPPPRVEWLNRCLLGSMQEACLISCLYMISTYPLPEELAVLSKRALPPGTAQTLGGCSSAHMFLHSKFAKVHTPSPLLLCVMLGVLTAALQVPVIGKKAGSTEHRTSHLGYITSLPFKICKTATLNWT